MPPQPLSTLATARIPATAARRVPVNEFKLSIRISASIGIAIGHPLDCPVYLLHFARVVSVGVVTETARTLQVFEERTRMLTARYPKSKNLPKSYLARQLC